MPETTVQIDGLKELDAALKAFPNRVQKRLLGGAVGKASQEIKKAVKREARARAFNTGALFRNIKSKRGKRPRQTVVRYMVGVEHGKVRPVDAAGTVSGRKGKRRRATRRERTGEDPYYYHFVELGTQRGISPARYMTEGIKRGAASARETLRKDLTKRIAKEFAKGTNR